MCAGAQGRTALACACERKHSDAIQLLVMQGSPLPTPSSGGGAAGGGGGGYEPAAQEQLESASQQQRTLLDQLLTAAENNDVEMMRGTLARVRLPRPTAWSARRCAFYSKGRFCLAVKSV